jgi:hypothetical protein
LKCVIASGPERDQPDRQMDHFERANEGVEDAAPVVVVVVVVVVDFHGSISKETARRA